jgi:hypothetical protein
VLTVGVFARQFSGGPGPFFSKCLRIHSWIVPTYDAMMNTVNYNASIEHSVAVMDKGG